MRIALALSALLALAPAAWAGPLAPAGLDAARPLVETVHHKPGHQGGPPWTRGRGRGDDRGYDRGFDRGDYRGFERGERYGFSERTETRRVTRCVTRYEERYDRYRDAYVRRPVEVCR